MATEMARLLQRLSARGCRPIVVASHPRSGTHLCIDTLRLNFRDCHSWKWPTERADRLYFSLDAFPTDPESAKILQRVPRPLVKTHALPGLADVPVYWGSQVALDPDLTAFLKERGAFVYAYRDGREALRSLYYMLEWRPTGTFASFSEFIHQRVGGMSRVRSWAEHVRNWMAAPNIHCVRMKELLERPDLVIPQMAAHLGLSGGGVQLPPRCGITFFNRLRRRISFQAKSTSIELPYQASKWSEIFTPDDREFFHREAGDLLISLGYEKSDQWVGRKIETGSDTASPIPISRDLSSKASFRRPDAIAS